MLWRLKFSSKWLCVWGPNTGPCPSFSNRTLYILTSILQSPNRILTSSAHVYSKPALTATAVLPAPRSIEGRFVPISARGEQEQE